MKVVKMANYYLTEGALKRLMNGEKIPEPIMQVLASKKINNSNMDRERYRIVLSDGKNFITFAMLSIQPGSDGFQINSVIKIKKSVLTTLKNIDMSDRKALLLLEIEVLGNGDLVGRVIGNPVSLEENNEPSISAIDASLTSETTDRTNNSCKIECSALNNTISDTKRIAPIESLNPYRNKWLIKARVVSKSDIRFWSNSRAEGKLFTFDVMDESGEIRCTAFNELTDKFFNYIQVDKVYYISKCQLKPAHTQFNQIKNEYEMTVTAETIIEECMTCDEVPKVKFIFTPINELINMDVGTLVDVIGVCKSSSDLDIFTSRATNRKLKRRHLQLVDQTKTAISMTLWGDQAENCDGRHNPVIVVKGAKVGEFGGGKNLSVLPSSQFKVNPDFPESFQIKSWYENEGKLAEFQSISEKIGMGAFHSPWMTFKEVQEQKQPTEMGEYYQTVGTVVKMRSENAIYKACPSADCNKKVEFQYNGMYRCEKCNAEYPNFKYKLIVTMNIGNWNANQWVSVFGKEAEKILGKTSEEVGLAKEKNNEHEIFKNAKFKQFLFKCRRKVGDYNGEEHLKTVVVKADL